MPCASRRGCHQFRLCFQYLFLLCTQKMCIPLYSLGIIRCLHPRGVSFFFFPNTKCCLLQVQVLISMSVCRHKACRNERTSIYEVRRKPFVIRGFPPNSLIFKFRRLFFYGCLRRCYLLLIIRELSRNSKHSLNKFRSLWQALKIS